jgi:hypothetical protein
VCDSICSSARAQTLTANSKADVWSVGVLLLLLLRNELPFTESDPTFFIEQVCACRAFCFDHQHGIRLGVPQIVVLLLFAFTMLVFSFFSVR